MPPPLVLLAAPPSAPVDDIRSALAADGFAVADHSFGALAPPDLGVATAAVIRVGDATAAAVAHTRLWRAAAGEPGLPVLWVLPVPSDDAAAAGLDAGADAFLVQPVAPAVLAAQVRALGRGRAITAALAGRAAEARAVNAQLQRAYSEIDQGITLSKRVQRTLLPQKLPAVGRVRFTAFHRPRTRVGGDVFDVARLDEHHVGFWLADAGGPGSVIGGLLGLVVKLAVVGKEVTGTSYRLVPPGDVLARVNRELLGLGMDPPPLVGMGFGRIDVRSGAVELARGGLPAPVQLPADGPPAAWVGPGPFLGAFDADFAPRVGRLAPGDRLILRTGGSDDGDRIPAVADAHRKLEGQAFAAAVAADLLAGGGEPEDLTLLVVEMQGEPVA